MGNWNRSWECTVRHTTDSLDALYEDGIARLHRLCLLLTFGYSDRILPHLAFASYTIRIGELGS